MAVSEPLQMFGKKTENKSIVWKIMTLKPNVKYSTCSCLTEEQLQRIEAINQIRSLLQTQRYKKNLISVSSKSFSRITLNFWTNHKANSKVFRIYLNSISEYSTTVAVTSGLCGECCRISGSLTIKKKYLLFLNVLGWHYILNLFKEWQLSSYRTVLPSGLAHTRESVLMVSPSTCCQGSASSHSALSAPVF